MKRNLLLTGGIICSTSLLSQQKPNIVLILADDMRGTTLEFLEKENVRTPELNQLSENCIVFPNAHIMGGSSGAVSMPSRAMLMTGKYLHKLEKQGAVIPESHTLIGEVLQKAGYQTFHTGKWHNGKDAFNRCFSSGKDIFFGGMADHWSVPLFNYDPDGQYANKRRIIKTPYSSNHVDTLDGEYVYSGKHSVDIFTETAIEFIERQKDKQQPFFLSVSYMSPHDPRSMPDEFMKQYDPEKIVLPDNYMEKHPFDNGELAVRDEVLAAIPRVKEEVKQHIADYYAMISHLDHRIGNIIKTLIKNNLYNNTIIIFTADNGLAVGQHGLMGKQNVYEHSIQVPLMIKPAGTDTERHFTDRLCYLIDLFPSICEWAGQSVPGSVDGISLLPVIAENKMIREHLYYAYRDFQRSISDGEWKLIEYQVNGNNHTQLFNLKNDPWETKNLNNEKKQAKRIKQLRDKMILLKTETGDQSGFWDVSHPFP